MINSTVKSYRSIIVYDVTLFDLITETLPEKFIWKIDALLYINMQPCAITYFPKELTIISSPLLEAYIIKKTNGRKVNGEINSVVTTPKEFGIILKEHKKEEKGFCTLDICYHNVPITLWEDAQWKFYSIDSAVLYY